MIGGGDDFEVDGGGCAWGDAVDFPCGGAYNADYGFANAAAFFAGGDAVPNESRDFEFLGGLDVEGGVEAHLEVTLFVLVEDAEEALFEDRGGEGIGEDDDTVRRVRHRFHLEQTNLI